MVFELRFRDSGEAFSSRSPSSVSFGICKM